MYPDKLLPNFPNVGDFMALHLLQNASDIQFRDMTGSTSWGSLCSSVLSYLEVTNGPVLQPPHAAQFYVESKRKIHPRGVAEAGRPKRLEREEKPPIRLGLPYIHLSPPL